MMYALIVIWSLNQPSNNEAQLLAVYRDLEQCLDEKEKLVTQKQDAHCFRLDEPATTVKDLSQ